MSLLSHFEGPDNERKLLDALERQSLCLGNRALASALADAGTLEFVAPGEALIIQGGTDKDLFLLLAGEARVLVHDREVARRRPDQHVGEMALIETREVRSATVEAVSPTVVLRISEPAFTTVADAHAVLWRRLAIELGDRVRQRNQHVRPPNERPLVFVGSSSEALTEARALQNALDHDDVDVEVWTDGVFGASSFPIDDLLRLVNKADFAVLVTTPDDRVVSRKSQSDAPRDNVVFELGLFMGAIGRERSFILSPRGVDLKIPSDLLGLTPVTYKNVDAGRLPAAIGPVANTIRDRIKALGVR